MAKRDGSAQYLLACREGRSSRLVVELLDPLLLLLLLGELLLVHPRRLAVQTRVLRCVHGERVVAPPLEVGT